jgi:hypothetical protein
MTATIKLKVPIRFGTENISELTFVDPKAKHFRDLPLEPKVGDLLDVASKLTGQPPSVLGELDPADLGEVLSHVGKSVEGGLATGVPPLAS